MIDVEIVMPKLPVHEHEPVWFICVRCGSRIVGECHMTVHCWCGAEYHLEDVGTAVREFTGSRWTRPKRSRV